MLNNTRRVGGAAALVLAAMLAASCSSSMTGGSNPSAASQAADPASSSSGGSSVAAAVAATKLAEQAPTTVPITTPLAKPAPRGKTFVWLQCELAQCKDMTNGFRAATAAIGWNLKVITYQNAEPSTLIAGFLQALQYHPVAVSAGGLPVAVWGSQVLPAYQKANVPIIVAYVGPQKLDKTIIANIGGPIAYTNFGNVVANWVIADSGGKAKILFYNVPDFSTFRVFADAFKQKIASDCPGCNLTDLQGTIAQAEGGQSVPAIISALQRNPDIKYVVTDDGAWVVGLPSALKAAGLTDVKIAGQAATVQNLADIKQGTENAFTGLALHYGAWATIDAALRHLEGMPIIDGNSALPTQLLTDKASFAVADSYDKPADFEAQMKKLWHVP